MNLEKVKFDIRRVFKPKEGRQYFILEAPGADDLIIPESKVRQLPTVLKRKFFMQRAISFGTIMPALNDWIKENNEKKKNPQSSGKIFHPSLENTTGGPQS